MSWLEDRQVFVVDFDVEAAASFDTNSLPSEWRQWLSGIRTDAPTEAESQKVALDAQRMREKVQTKDQELEQLRGELQQAHAEVESVQAQQQEAAAQSSEHASDRAELQAQIEKTRAENDERARALSLVEDECASLREQQAASIQQLATAQEELAATQGAKDEAETAMKGMIDRWLADRDFVTREEFDAVRAMAQKAREENETLKARIEALEAK